MVDKIKSLDLTTSAPAPTGKTAPTLSVDDASLLTRALYKNTTWTGEKFPGGFGPIQVQQIDYWALRAASEQLFNTNLYAAGLIKRLITNIINTGIMPEACPHEKIIGLAESSLDEWTETTETRFGIWGKLPKVCDWNQALTWGALQRAAKTAAFITGDTLVVMQQSRATSMPMVQLVSGNKVQTPFYSEKINLKKGHTIVQGVEFDANKRVVGHWVRQEDGSTKRIPAWGKRGGRRISWLVFGSEKRFDDVRGVPILSLVLQSLKEVDRYRDSTQRKAVINSILAMFIKKTDDKPSSLPTQGGAVRNDAVSIIGQDGEARQFNIANQIPGMVIEELQTGEEPVLKGGEGTDINFPVFEAAIIQAVAWFMELPPEIATLAFSNNYSASQAAINEFIVYLRKEWSAFGDSFCTPIYIEWLLSEALLGKTTMPGFLEAWRNPAEYDIFGAWTSVIWYGSVKPSTDMLKQMKGSEKAIELGLTTRAREARLTTGTKFTYNVKRLALENTQLAAALRPMLELEAEFGTEQTAVAKAAAEANDNLTLLVDNMEEVS